MTPAAGRVTDAKFVLQYGDLEKLLLDLGMGPQSSIASRFRKLRPKFARDNLLSKTGNRVSYDLTRVLSICAIFQLNSMGVPQGDAVSIVISNWPEIARAFLLASRSSEASREEADPLSDGLVQIYVDAFPLSAPAPTSWASIAEVPPIRISHIVLDCRPIFACLGTVGPEAVQQLPRALEELERTFGWERLGESEAPRLPERLDSGFFGSGPYFERARVLVAMRDPTKLPTFELERLQAYLTYVEAPPPIDSWKQYIGTGPGEPRLIHLLAVCGLELGLKSRAVGSDTLRVAAFPSAARALDLIERGEAHLAATIR